MALIALIAGLWHSNSTRVILNTERVERSIEASIVAQRHLASMVGCQVDIVQKAGVVFDCQATVRGRQFAVVVTETDGNGHVITYDVASICVRACRTQSRQCGASISVCRIEGYRSATRLQGKRGSIAPHPSGDVDRFVGRALVGGLRAFLALGGICFPQRNRRGRAHDSSYAYRRGAASWSSLGGSVARSPTGTS